MQRNTKVVIVGTGFSGLCLAINLKKHGINDFIILEKADDVGGTWRENTYLGAECDIPSALYSYSFEQSDDWDFRWAGQAQILSYIKNVASKHDLYKNIEFGQTVTKAHYDQKASRWNVTSVTGDTEHTWQAQFFVSAVGQLHYPRWPNINGMDSFTGDSFHSAEWDHSIGIKGRKVAVIGNGASAIQFIPELAKDAQELHVFQRTPNWILPKMDPPYTERQKWWRQKLPILSMLDRLWLWLRGEFVLFPIMKGNRFFQATTRFLCLRHMHKHIKDDRLRAQLTPDYTVGAKRILFADTYYPALAKPHVHVHSDAVNEIAENALRFGGGEITDVDVIVYGTGFITNPFLYGLDITGRNNITLRDHWQEGAKSYLGITCSGFPNFFMMYGPNTNLGHNSIVQMIEAQTNFIIEAITATENAIEVSAKAEKAFDDDTQERLRNMVWDEVDSWYKQGDRSSNNWAGSVIEYRRRTKHLNKADFLFS